MNQNIHISYYIMRHFAILHRNYSISLSILLILVFLEFFFFSREREIEKERIYEDIRINS